MDFSFNEEQQAIAGPGRADPRGPVDPRAPARSIEADGRRVRPRAVGRARRGRPARHRRARGRRRERARLRRAVPDCSSRSGRTSAPVPCLGDVVLGALADRAVRHRRAASAAACRAWSPASRSSPRRWPRRAPTRSRPTTDGPPTATAGASTARRCACPPAAVADARARPGRDRATAPSVCSSSTRRRGCGPRAPWTRRSGMPARRASTSTEARRRARSAPRAASRSSWTGRARHGRAVRDAPSASARRPYA